MSEGIRYEFAFGTYEDALRMIGVQTEPRYAGTAVSGARIQIRPMVHDPNPGYWDVDFARETWGGLVAPPAMLMGWLIPPPWLPTDGRRGLDRDPGALPGTTMINASNEAEFLAPSSKATGSPSSRSSCPSPWKKTTDWAPVISSRHATSITAVTALVATNRNTLFRFTPAAHP